MELEPLERAVLNKFLEGNDPVLDALRRQMPGISVVERKKTGTGFFTELSNALGTERAPTRPGTSRLGDLEATIDGLAHGAGFLLYVHDGLLSMLEGYSYEEPWPTEIRNFALRFSKADRSAVLSKLRESNG